jgi:ferredoxin
MRIEVDLDRCEAHGECVMAAPEVFELDDEDQLHYDAQPDEALRPLVTQAVRSCRVQAIRLVD